MPVNPALESSGRRSEKLRLAWATEKVLGPHLVVSKNTMTQHNTTQRANKLRKPF